MGHATIKRPELRDDLTSVCWDYLRSSTYQIEISTFTRYKDKKGYKKCRN